MDFSASNDLRFDHMSSPELFVQLTTHCVCFLPIIEPKSPILGSTESEISPKAPVYSHWTEDMDRSVIELI